jgi:tRNA-Thr(GGU) m(6)t(6)A37 methyltransferase TsaA
MRPIGVVHTPFAEGDEIPIQPAFSQAAGQVELDAAYAEGLQDLEGFSHIILIYALHRSEGFALRVKPFLDREERGVFATRYPRRPNPIGLSVVRLVARRGNLLEIAGADMLDGTPLLDIKPYVPEFDRVDGGTAGWYDVRPAGGRVVQRTGDRQDGSDRPDERGAGPAKPRS